VVEADPSKKTSVDINLDINPSPPYTSSSSALKFEPKSNGESETRQVEIKKDGAVVQSYPVTVTWKEKTPEPPKNEKPTATDVSIPAFEDTITYNLASSISDKETADSGLTVEVVS
jgi:hypothetical protein